VSANSLTSSIHWRDRPTSRAGAVDTRPVSAVEGRRIAFSEPENGVDADHLEGGRDDVKVASPQRHTSRA
jgi:hypothetical protein